jgi:hypothetical protein
MAHSKKLSGNCKYYSIYLGTIHEGYGVVSVHSVLDGFAILCSVHIQVGGNTSAQNGKTKLIYRRQNLKIINE